MFKKTLFKKLQKLSPEDKLKAREILKESISEDGDEIKNNNGEKNVMDKNAENEKKPTENVEETTEKVEEVAKTDETPVETTEEVVKTEEATEPTEKPVEEETQPKVEVEEESQNAIPLSELVTKDELMERLSAFEAKFQALVKENQDLKEKYENKDFGNNQRQGMMPKDKIANSSFDEYSKNFM